MTESPQEQHNVPPEEEISPAQADEQLDTDPELVPNAPNRDPSAPGAGNDPEAADPRSDERDG